MMRVIPSRTRPMDAYLLTGIQDMAFKASMAAPITAGWRAER